jgi:hypothetical protein
MATANRLYVRLLHVVATSTAKIRRAETANTVMEVCYQGTASLVVARATDKVISSHRLDHRPVRASKFDTFVRHARRIRASCPGRTSASWRSETDSNVKYGP